MRTNRIIMLGMFFVVMFSGVFCLLSLGEPQTDGRDPDAWEAHWNSLQPADKVMKTMGVIPGMNIGEVGAGRGRYAVLMAKGVGSTGKIYANDINSRSLEYLNHRCKRDGITNIETILGTAVDPRFPKGKLDFVYFINTYHHIDRPVALLRNIIPGLKPGGRIVIIEHAPEKATDMGSHATPKETVLRQAKEAGLTLERIETFLEYDNIYIFQQHQL